MGHCVYLHVPRERLPRHVSMSVRHIIEFNRSKAHCSRFVLGLTEAPFYPGAIYMISIFYARKETATRLSIFYTGNLLASAFSGLIAAGVFAGLDGKAGLEGWRWLFLIQGVVTGTCPIALIRTHRWD